MRNILIILAGLAVLAVAALAIYQWRGGPRLSMPGPQPEAPAAVTPEEAARARAIGPDDYVIGSAEAPVTVIEYASLTCPHCADFHVKTLPEVKALYIDTGKVRFAFRDFPLDRAALAAAMVARCAGGERRGALVDLFFRRQEAWTQAEDPIAAMARQAALAGMGEDEIQACLQNDEVAQAALDSRLLAEKAFGVNSTPSFIINGEKHAGFMTTEEFKAIIEPLLNKPAE